MNVVMFIKNTTGNSITHEICVRMSARDNSSRRAQVALNGSAVYTYNSNNITTNCSKYTFPANKTSMLSMQCGGYYWTGNYSTYWGSYMCNFYDNRLGYKKYSSKGLRAWSTTTALLQVRDVLMLCA